MGLTIIALLEEKPLEPYACGICQTATRKNKFFWKSWFTGKELNICRDCAYREKYGTKGMIKAKKEKLLEKESDKETDTASLGRANWRHTSHLP
jgi:ribosome-binding protein aMBF1 (putative translation factor)